MCASKCVDSHCCVLKSAVVSTVAGGVFGTTPATVDATGSQAAFYRPWRAAVDASGNIIVGGDDNRIRKITSAAVVTTLAGGELGMDNGIGTQARFWFPFGVAFDARSGNIIVADTYNRRLRTISPANGTLIDAGGGAQPLRRWFMTRIVNFVVLWRVMAHHQW